MKLFFVMFFSAFCLFSQGTTYYVTTTGNASNSGLSEGNAWSLSKAFSSAQAGDIVNIKKGIYSNFKITQNTNGTALNPITFRGYNNSPGDITTTTTSTYVWNTAINGNVMPLIREARASNGVGNGTALTINGNYVHIQNIAIQYYSVGIRINGNFGKYTNVSAHEPGNFDPSLTSPPNPNQFLNYAGRCFRIAGDFNDFKNIYAEDAGAENIALSGDNNSFSGVQVHAKNTVNPTDYYFLFQGGSNNTLTNLLIHRHGNLRHYGHGLVFKSANTTTNNLVEDFLVRNTSIELQYPGVFNNVIRNGEVIKEPASISGSSENIGGINLANGSRDNFFEDIIVSNASIRFSDWNDGLAGDPPGKSSDDNIFNRVTINSNWAAVHFFYFGNNNYSSTATGNKFYNCTFHRMSDSNFSNRWLFERSRANSGTVFTNCIFSGFTSYGSPRSSSPGFNVVATWTKNNLFNSSVGSIQGTQTGTTTANPLFTNAGALDFSLQAGSPLRGQGVATPFMAAGNDIGAWQSTGGAPADITPPIITEVVESQITENSIQVEFRFDEGSTGRIEWGLTTSFGNFTTLEPSFLTFHRQNITGLSPGTLYYYRILGEDAAGNEVTGSQRSATTVGSGETPEQPISVGIIDRRGKGLKTKKIQ